MILGNPFVKAIPAPIRSALAPLLRPLVRYWEHRRLTRMYAGFFKRGDLVFDIGAHTGDMAEILVGLGAKVVSVDPQPACVDVLRKRFAGRPEVLIEPVGVGEAPGELEFSICAEGPQVSTFSEKWKHGRYSHLEWDEKIKVPVTTLDALIEKHGLPRYCKIDVEGFEVEVLKGLRRPVAFVSFEFTREFLGDARACIGHLESLAPARYQVSLYTRHSHALPDWVDARELLRYLEARPEADLCGDIYARTP